MASFDLNISSAVPGAVRTSASRILSPARFKLPTINTQSTSDAATVRLSTSERASSRATSKALRSLSEASSYISIGQDAATQVENLLDRALAIANKLNTALDPNTRSQLATEATSILSEIDTVTANAEYNDVSVVDGGDKVFQVNLDQTDKTTGSTYSVQVLDVRVSRSDLSISSLSASDFNNNASQTITTLETAQGRAQAVAVNLNNAEQQVENIGEQFGLVVKKQATSAASSAKDLEPENLAKNIASAVDKTLSSAAHNLDPLRVQDLLVPVTDTSPASSPANESSPVESSITPSRSTSDPTSG